MSILVELRKAIAEAFSPSPVLIRVRIRATSDMLLTLLITAVAVVLAVGYQVLGRWGRRTTPTPD